jgi:hypothetical protein
VHILRIESVSIRATSKKCKMLPTEEEQRLDHATNFEATLPQKSELRVDTSFKMFMKLEVRNRI